MSALAATIVLCLLAGTAISVYYATEAQSARIRAEELSNLYLRSQVLSEKLQHSLAQIGRESTGKTFEEATEVSASSVVRVEGTAPSSNDELRIPLDLRDASRTLGVEVEVVRLAGVAAPVAFEPSSKLDTDNPVEIVIGNDGQINLIAAITSDPKSPHPQLVIRPRYSAAENRQRTRTLNANTFNIDLAALMRATARGCDDFSTAINKMPGLQTEIEQLKREVVKMGRNNPSEKEHFNNLLRNLQRLGLQETKVRGSLRRRSNSLPSIYRALADMFYIGKVSQQLVANGELELLLPDQTEIRRVKLFPADAPNTFEVPTNLEVADEWLDLKEVAIYRLKRDGDFEFTTLEARSNTAGRWTKKGDTVTLIAAGGIAAEYKLHEDIILWRPDSSLYRALKRVDSSAISSGEKR